MQESTAGFTVVEMRDIGVLICYLFHTLRYTRPIQVFYRLYYGIHRRFLGLPGRKHLLGGAAGQVSGVGQQAEMLPSIDSQESCGSDGVFTFLNRTHSFPGKIDWNFAGYGKLWTYNLCYFDFLLQEDMDVDTGICLVLDFIEQIDSVTDGLEPYPVSVRGINWIKFLLFSRIGDESRLRIEESLRCQYRFLAKNLEYHLLGNHLLENGFSLLFGAVYFGDERLHRKARKILFRQLGEQVLSDGGHFELSPMYHCLILFRLLDAYNLAVHSEGELLKGDAVEEELKQLLRRKAEAMLSWLRSIMYADGSIAMFNDSAPGIAPSPRELLEYARRLGLVEDEAGNTALSESGYRVFHRGRFEFVADVGPLGPSYIPGHAHCDMLSFEMRIDRRPFLIDTGTSTYERGERRLRERGTAAHNTVIIDGTEQSEIWNSFRVARRAQICLEEEGKSYLRAYCRNYRRKSLHRRDFNLSDKEISIVDTIDGERVGSTAFFHFAPGLIPRKGEAPADGSLISVTTERADLSFFGAERISIEENACAGGFNRLQGCTFVRVDFHGRLETKILLK